MLVLRDQNIVNVPKVIRKRLVSPELCLIKFSVYACKKLEQERQCALASFSARAIQDFCFRNIKFPVVELFQMPH